MTLVHCPLFTVRRMRDLQSAMAEYRPKSAAQPQHSVYYMHAELNGSVHVTGHGATHYGELDSSTAGCGAELPLSTRQAGRTIRTRVIVRKASEELVQELTSSTRLVSPTVFAAQVAGRYVSS